MFFLINKELGISSFGLVREVRKKLNIKKVGHTGTLDPLASGCMIIATGNSTKLIPFLEKDKKTYKSTICLNYFSTTGDSEGDLIDVDFNNLKKLENLDKVKIQEIINKNFIGKITQIPPKYSALKINGKPAYKYMREGDGDSIKISEREVEIFYLNVLDFYKKNELYFLDIETEVSAGTYIRTLGEDIGKELSVGGYLTRLERTQIGNLNIQDSINIDEVSESSNIPLGKIFNFKSITVSDEIINLALEGKSIINIDFLEYFSKLDICDKFVFIKNQNITCLLEIFSSEDGNIVLKVKRNLVD